MISSTDFKNWLSDPVTVKFMQTVQGRILEATENLSYVAGIDSNHDNFVRGFIQGQREVLEVSFEDETNG